MKVRADGEDRVRGRCTRIGDEDGSEGGDDREEDADEAHVVRVVAGTVTGVAAMASEASCLLETLMKI